MHRGITVPLHFIFRGLWSSANYESAVSTSDIIKYVAEHEHSIVFRVLQGIGAAGGFALLLLFINGMVPAEKYPLYGGIMAADMALANLAGPLAGGALSSPSKWRWAFLLK